MRRDHPSSSGSDDRATRLTRRTFVVGMGLAAILATWQLLLAPAWKGSGGEQADFENLLTGTAARIGIPVEIGQSFLGIRGEFTRPLLIAELTAFLREGSRLPSDEEDLLKRLRREVNRDHLAGRIVSLEGRRLSLTEARLAALRYLVGPVEGDGEISHLVLFSHIRVSQWGPQSTPFESPFNRQPDGSSAFWFQGEGFPAGLIVQLGDTQLPTQLQPGLATAALREPLASEFLGRAGAYPIHFLVPDQVSPQLVGFFHVLPSRPGQDYFSTPLDLTDFDPGRTVEIHQWGPGSTRPGEAFNPQSDGSSAFWVRCGTEAAPGSFLVLESIPLLTELSGSVITARLVQPLAQQMLAIEATLPLQLVDPSRRVVQKVGDFQVRKE